MRSRALLLGIMLLLAACNMRVTGTVSDAASGQPIGACAVSVDQVYTHTDPMGRYNLVTRHRRQESIKYVAPGYAVMTKTINAEDTRYPVLDVELRRLRASSAPAGARFDPYTGEPLQHEVPRFDPYTGEPLDPQPRQSE